MRFQWFASLRPFSRVTIVLFMDASPFRALLAHAQLHGLAAARALTLKQMVTAFTPIV